MENNNIEELDLKKVVYPIDKTELNINATLQEKGNNNSHNQNKDKSEFQKVLDEAINKQKDEPKTLRLR